MSQFSIFQNIEETPDELIEHDLYNHENFLINQRINYVDCNIKLSEDTLLDGDYHPNVKAHVLYSRCITSYLKRNNLLF